MTNEKTAVKVPEGKTLKIVARRWFQKTYGNTYHSVRIYEVSGTGSEYKETLIAEQPFEYGYDRQYLQTAVDLLNDINYFGGTVGYRELINMLGGDVIERVTDVQRKKDL